MSDKHLFHIHNKQQLIYTSGNFHAIRGTADMNDEITKGPVL